MFNKQPISELVHNCWSLTKNSQFQNIYFLDFEKKN